MFGFISNDVAIGMFIVMFLIAMTLRKVVNTVSSNETASAAAKEAIRRWFK